MPIGLLGQHVQSLSRKSQPISRIGVHGVSCRVVARPGSIAAIFGEVLRHAHTERDPLHTASGARLSRPLARERCIPVR
jgi:hypothetical protein